MTETDTQAPEATKASPLVYVREVLGAEIQDEAAQSGIELDADATLYAIHTEDGTRRVIFSDRDAAFEAAIDHGAQPVSVH